ncbi:MAG: hypothetical protein M3P49_15635 [Actinomycetota bacterium]|nr:hypothetical protein [Actinomycetota bacterium]
MKLWVDDARTPPPGGWAWAKTVGEAVRVLEGGGVAEASLDHDLGEGYGREGYDLLLWMVEHGRWPSRAITVHSANPPGAERMCGVVERYGPYRRVAGTRRFVRREEGQDETSRRPGPARSAPTGRRSRIPPQSPTASARRDFYPPVPPAKANS